MSETKVTPPGSVLLLVLVALCALSVLLIVITRRSMELEVENVRRTRLCLSVSGAAMEDFVRRKGRFPNSLAELSAYMKEQYWSFPAPGEWISKRAGDFSSHRELDNTGGVYYNPHTGELKVNLTQPVRQYFWRYIGADGDNIPAKW